MNFPLLALLQLPHIIWIESWFFLTNSMLRNVRVFDFPARSFCALSHECTILQRMLRLGSFRHVGRYDYGRTMNHLRRYCFDAVAMVLAWFNVANRTDSRLYATASKCGLHDQRKLSQKLWCCLLLNFCCVLVKFSKS